jgi:hypothetical protein
MSLSLLEVAAPNLLRLCSRACALVMVAQVVLVVLDALGVQVVQEVVALVVAVGLVADLVVNLVVAVDAW